MTDIPGQTRRDESQSDVLERIREEHYPHIDRELVRELLRLHDEPDDDLERAIDDLIFARTGA